MASEAEAKLREANAKFEQLQREDEQRVRKQGMLQKQGGGKRRANWKKRWFVLQLGKLTYYADESKKTVKGTIDIVYDPTNRVAISDHKEHCFFITRDNARTFFITASDDGQRNEWIKAVQECFQIKREQHERAQKDLSGGSGVRASAVVPLTSQQMSLADPYDQNVVRHEGWLEKKGGGKTRANWTKRWFVVRLRAISYYTDQKKTTMKGVIPLDESITASPSAAKVFAISISVPGRIFLVDAHSEPERNTWLAVINECVKLMEEQKKLKLMPSQPLNPNAPSLLPPPSLSATSSSSSPSRSAIPPPSLSGPPPSSLSGPPPSLAAPPAFAARPPSALGGIPLLAAPGQTALRPISDGPLVVTVDLRRPPSSNPAAVHPSSSAAPPSAASAPESKELVEAMDSDSLAQWLVSIGLSRAAVAAFRDNQMTGKDLLELTSEELTGDLGLDQPAADLLLRRIQSWDVPHVIVDPKTWDMARCLEWLHEIDCPLAALSFQENQLTGLDIFELSQNEVEEELGIPTDDSTPQRLWKQITMLKLRHTPHVPGHDY